MSVPLSACAPRRPWPSEPGWIALRNAALLGDSPVFHARVTALVGVLMLASGTFAGAVGSKLIARDDLALTAGNLLASPLLFRLGLAASLVMMVAFIFYALLLHRLLEPVNRHLAAAMVVLALVSVPVFMLNQANQYALLLTAADPSRGQAALFLELYRLGNLIAGIFFGLWLFPLGLLVYRSGFLPRALGMLLMVGTSGYLVLFVQAFFFPGTERTLWTNPLLLVTHASELALMLWLLVRGVKAGAYPR